MVVSDREPDACSGGEKETEKNYKPGSEGDVWDSTRHGVGNERSRRYCSSVLFGEMERGFQEL